MVIEPGNSSLTKTPINKNGVEGSPSSSARAKEATSSTAMNVAKDADSTKSSDSVSLSVKAQALGRLEAKMSEAPSVDSAKVEALKKAVAEGSYQVDSDKVAEKMLAQDSHIFG